MTDDSQIQVQSHDQRSAVNRPEFIVSHKAREVLKKTGAFLIDLALVSDRIILPQVGPEMTALAREVFTALMSNKSVAIYTPVCPDWSRDSQGRYDFKSLGTGPSFIAQKFLQESSLVLEIFKRHSINYEGYLVFADWGLETEISAKNTYGESLAPDEVTRYFAASFHSTQELMASYQVGEKGGLFDNYQLISMTEFLAMNLADPKQVCQDIKERFLTVERARRLLELYHQESREINRQRLGLCEEENYQTSLTTLAEYTTLGTAIKSGLLMVAESRIASLAYNALRPKNDRLAVIFLKGKQGLDQGVNIL